jgi:hypothetical protein
MGEDAVSAAVDAWKKTFDTCTELVFLEYPEVFDETTSSDEAAPSFRNSILLALGIAAVATAFEV